MRGSDNMKKIVYFSFIFFISFLFIGNVYADMATCVYNFGGLNEHLEISFDQENGKKFTVSCYDSSGADCSSNYNISKLKASNFKVSSSNSSVKYECLSSIYYTNTSNTYNFSTKAGGSSKKIKLNKSASNYSKDSSSQNSGNDIECSYKVSSAGADKNAKFVFTFSKDFKKFSVEMTGNAGKSYDLRPDENSFKEEFKNQYNQKNGCPNVYTTFYDYAGRYTASMTQENLQDGSQTTDSNIHQESPSNLPTGNDITELYDNNWSNSEGCIGLEGSETLKILKQILDYLRLAAVALLLVLGSLDFAGAIFSDKDDAMKQAGNKFIKRLIATVIVFLVPVLVNIILFIADKSESVCGLLT